MNDDEKILMRPVGARILLISLKILRLLILSNGGGQNSKNQIGIEMR